MSRRATESFRAIGIRGGADPSQGVPGTSPQYYEISDDDRALLEGVISDTNSSDAARRAVALQWWNDALATVLPSASLTSQLLTGDPGIFSAILDLFGFKLYQSFNILENACETDNSAGVVTAASLTAGAGSQVNLNYKVATATTKWQCVNAINPDTGNPAVRFINPGINIRIRDEPFDAFSTIRNYGNIGFYVDGELDDFGGTTFCTPPDDIVQAHGGAAGEYSGTFNTDELDEGKCIVVEIGVIDGWDCAREVCRGEDLGFPSYEPFGSPSPTPVSPVDGTIPIDPCDLIDALKDYPYAPEPGTPVGTPPGGPIDTPPIDPGTGLPPGTVPGQPVDPGANPGPGEPIPDIPGVPGDPGLPPGDPGLPVDPGIPGPETPIDSPIDSGIEDPVDGGCSTLPGEPAGFRDPKQPGGISRKFQPGQPVTIDYGAGSTCKVKITRVKQDKDLQTGEKGVEICVSPTIDNSGKTTEKTCYGPGPVTEAISSVLGDMIAEGGQIIFDSDCTRELQRPMCFRAGTSKRVILNKLLDMCGFCVFPMFDCNVIVGFCGPVNVHWTYHEDVDLMAFDVEYDNLETYDYVQVYRGDKMNQSGQILEAGAEVFYPVGSPTSSVSGDRVFQHEVPYGTSQTDMLAIAMDLAAKYRLQAMPLVAFGVPLNSQLLPRHQLHFKRPSLGLSATYMATRVVRDYDRENGHLSTGLARWLSGS